MATKKRPPDEKINTDSGLTDQAETFCREYLFPSDGSPPYNATQAYIRAGYSENGARAGASRLLANVNIQKHLAALKAPLLKAHEITAERIIAEYASIAFANIQDYVRFDDNGMPYFDLQNMTREQAAAISDLEVTELPPVMTVIEGQEFAREVVKVKVKRSDKQVALDALVKLLGHNKPDKVEVHHSGTINLDATERARRVAFLLRDAQEKEKAKKAKGAREDKSGKVAE
ncbi:MAG: terminase small subunit [Kiritimatiellia bacterium]